MGAALGTIGTSFGHFIWSREGQHGSLESLVLTEDEFWRLCASNIVASDLASDIEAIGGPAQDGKPRSPFAFASPQTDRARGRVYRHASKRIADGLAWSEPQLREIQSRVLKFAADDDWMVALDVFGLHRPDFQFSKLAHPFAGIVLTLNKADNNAPTAYDATKSVAVEISQVSSVEGQGGRWTLALHCGSVVELSRDRGLQVGAPVVDLTS